MVELPYELASVGVVTTKFVYGDHNTGHTAVKRKNPTPLPVFVASNFARV